jgi:hypothetical protein
VESCGWYISRLSLIDDWCNPDQAGDEQLVAKSNWKASPTTAATTRCCRFAARGKAWDVSVQIGGLGVMVVRATLYGRLYYWPA